MSNNSNVSKIQQNQASQKIEKAKIEQSRGAVASQDKHKFERMARLLDIYSKMDMKKEDVEMLAGPMDILREVGQFLVDLSNKDMEVPKHLDKNPMMEYTLQQGTVKQEVVQQTAPKQVDIDKLERLVERIVTNLPTPKTPEVQIKVSDSVLPETNITVKQVDGVLSVHIDSGHADTIQLLNTQGFALQQMLENRTGENVVVELNYERVEAREESKEREKEQQQQNKEDDDDNS